MGQTYKRAKCLGCPEVQYSSGGTGIMPRCN